MSTIPAPASTAEAIAMYLTSLRHLAGTDPTTLVTQAKAAKLRDRYLLARGDSPVNLPLPASFSWHMTGWVMPLPLCGTCRLPRCRCLPCLPTNHLALTPPANPPSKPGFHHSRLPWLSPEESWRATSAALVLRLLIPGLAMHAEVSAQT